MTLTPQATAATTAIQGNMNAYWSAQAADYDANQRRPERLARDVAAWSEIWGAALPTAPADVLDLGTGSGFVAFVHAGLGHRVVATDLAEGMI